MHKKLSLIAASSLAGLALVVSSLNAADAPAPAAAAASASGSAAAAPKPAAPGPDLSKLVAASDKKGLLFEKDVQPILKASCSGCHVNPTRAPSGGLNLTSLDLILKSKNAAKDIVAGHSDQSLVVLYASDLVKGKEMPPMGGRTAHPAIKAEDMAIIRGWIDQGAKGDPAAAAAAAAASASASGSGAAKPAAASASASGSAK